jgi:Acetyltransferase (GNAT) domain
MRLEQVPCETVEWAQLRSAFNMQFCQSAPWLMFAASISGGKPVVAQLVGGSEVRGYFFGVVFRRFGVKILGSPFPGWAVPYLGFALRDHTDFPAALKALDRFAFRELSCVHYELTDRTLGPEQAQNLGVKFDAVQSFLSDLTLPEEQIFALMSSACRRAIRKAHKSGVTVEEAEPDGFVPDYLAHLSDVFNKQGLRPTHGAARVENLIRHLHPTGQLLLLRARGPDGRSIATGIYPGSNGYSFFWGNGSLRSHLHLRPNEALHWHALQTWKARGSRSHDWGGAGEYKRKYGGDEFHVASVRRSRFAAISWGRDVARRTYYQVRNMTRRSEGVVAAAIRKEGGET